MLSNKLKWKLIINAKITEKISRGCLARQGNEIDPPEHVGSQTRYVTLSIVRCVLRVGNTSEARIVVPLVELTICCCSPSHFIPLTPIPSQRQLLLCTAFVVVLLLLLVFHSSGIRRICIAPQQTESTISILQPISHSLSHALNTMKYDTIHIQYTYIDALWTMR